MKGKKKIPNLKFQVGIWERYEKVENSCNFYEVPSVFFFLCFSRYCLVRFIAFRSFSFVSFFSLSFCFLSSRFVLFHFIFFPYLNECWFVCLFVCVFVLRFSFLLVVLISLS